MKKLFLLILLVGIAVAGYLYKDMFSVYFQIDEVQNILSNISLPGSEEQEDFSYTLNKDISSDLALVATNEQQDSFVAFTKQVNGTERLDKLVLQGANGEQALLEVNDRALPTRFSTNGITVEYSNYTESTVDIVVTRPDGSSEIIENSPLNLPQEFSLPFIDQVQASGPGISPQSGVTRSGDEATYMEYILSSSGTALNVLTCGVTLGLSLTTSGATSPFAYLKCAPLAVRLATAYTELGGCSGDVLDCAKDAILDSFRVKGPTIGGVVTNRESGAAVSGATITVKDKQGRIQAKAISGSHGHYTLPSIDLGAYTIEVTSSIGDAVYVLATTDDRIQVSGESSKEVDQSYSRSDRNGFSKIPGYFGNEVNQIHNVRFDVLLGDAGKYDGEWAGVATSSQSIVGDTECADATFTWNIAGPTISGTAIVDNDYSVSLEGSVDSNGRITAGLGSSLFEQVTFNGQLNDIAGSGTWIGASGCTGSFTASKQETSTEGIQQEIEPVF